MMLEDGVLDLRLALLRDVHHQQQLTRGQTTLKAVQSVVVLLAAEQSGHHGPETCPGHRPRQLSPDLVREADVLIAMTERHRSRILVSDPLARDRVFLLAGLAGELKGRPPRGYRHIGDPYGGPLRGYTRAFRRIRRELESACEAILERARDRRERELMKLRESATKEGVLG